MWMGLFVLGSMYVVGYPLIDTGTIVLLWYSTYIQHVVHMYDVCYDVCVHYIIYLHV